MSPAQVMSARYLSTIYRCILEERRHGRKSGIGCERYIADIIFISPLGVFPECSANNQPGGSGKDRKNVDDPRLINQNLPHILSLQEDTLNHGASGSRSGRHWLIVQKTVWDGNNSHVSSGTLV